jgi:hypothetical protein
MKIKELSRYAVPLRDTDNYRNHRGHFFDRDTMRFFASRVCETAYRCPSGVVYFLTSEKKCFNDPTRVWNARMITAHGTICNLNPFGSYVTKNGAIREIAECIGREVNV